MAQHRDALEKVREALEDNDSNVRMFVYSKVVGGPGRMYAICFGMDSWAEMWPDKTNLWDKLEKTFGEGRGMRFLMLAAQRLKITILKGLLFRPDLSTPSIKVKQKKKINKKNPPKILGGFFKFL
ncbi:MAG: hypothetical protein CM1200mP10_16840 [Candidatus Neomarinimicrobiota bacterium]|nr:MAG: hypothetical protein CM1200mP10_16840 [Candidatus Neomarinimicrobiota bacterium]